MRTASASIRTWLLIAALSCCPSAVADEPKGATDVGRVKFQFRHSHPIFALAYSPDGRWLATAGYDRREWPEAAPADSPPQLRVWDLATGKEAFAFRCHGGRLFSLAFSPDGKTLVSGGDDGTLGFWDMRSQKEITPRRNFPGRYSVHFSADGKRLAVADNEEVYVVDFATGQRTCRIRADMTKLAFSPGEKILVSAGGHDLFAYLWDENTGKELRRFKGDNANFVSLGFLADGKTLATSGDNPAIKLWEVATGKERLRIGSFGATHFDVAPDGWTLAAANDENTLRLCATGDGKELGRIGSHPDMVHAVAFAPDGKTVTSAGEDGSIIVWDLGTWAGHAKLQITQHSDKDCDRLWEGLGDDDAAAAYEAVVTLSRGPRSAVLFLRERLKPVASPKLPPEDELVRLLAAVGGDRYADRQAASKALRDLGHAVAPHLRTALKAASAVEARRRLEIVLEQIERLSAADMRALRAVEVLERIGTSDVVPLLETLARGLPAAPLTQAANESLARITRRRLVAGKP